ncbi:MAG TPA: group 1 truncated hemoglobin [Rhodocyclaceae bacterium]|nr:group 1 truncated hemoglobin [Rhodocyclaceae bacterium]
MESKTWFGGHTGVGRFILILGLGMSVVAGPVAAAADAPAPSLYTRLGGYDAIRAVVDDLGARLAADPELGRFWANRGSDGIAREKQLLVNFIVNRAGGPLYYTGRDMKISHVGMRISERDWQLLMVHVNATLAKFKVPAAEKADVLAFVESTKADMVEK